MTYTTTHQTKKPSSAERAKLRVKLAQEYGNGSKRGQDIRVRCGSGAQRGYRIETYSHGTDILCHECERNLQIADHTDKFTYCEMDRIDAGGDYVMGNLLPSCRTCNARRGDADLTEQHVADYRARY